MKHADLWEKAVQFHGHKCGGLAIGWSAALLAMELLNLTAPAADEEIVCVSENDACGVDAIQAILGCTAGKGNLLFRLRGKQAFSFFNRKNGGGIRLVLKEAPLMPREEKLEYMLTVAPGDLFLIKEPAFGLPQLAKLFNSAKCAVCGETAAEPWLRIRDGNALCQDCSEYWNALSLEPAEKQQRSQRL